MSKRNRTPAPGAGGRARSAPVKVSKPFPWGTVLVSVLLGALLIGIVAYAFLNQGTGVRDLLKEDDESFSGLITAEGQLARDHVDGQVEYPGFPERPPMGGEHNSVWQNCGVYDAEIPPEHGVHSLEHGAVWATSQPDLPEDQVEALREEVERASKGLLSPLPGQKAPIVLTAWGRQLEVQEADDDRVSRFVDTYSDGRQTPEIGAACSGGISATGRSPLTGGGQPMPPGAPGGQGEQAPAEPAPGGQPAPEGQPAPAPSG